MSLKFNRGRFAPSPSGPLHFGSLVAALGSYLIAKQAGAKWLVRIEDIDPPREVKGASDTILAQLESFGLYWDGPILYQSQRLDFYQDTLSDLHNRGLVYACDCTRKKIKEFNSQAHTNSNLYPNICQHKNLVPKQEVALRLRHGTGDYNFDDLLQGRCQFSQALCREDFTVKRKDGLIAYQLAVVLDDIEQNIDHVVRGCDLLDSTPRQLRLYEVLKVKPPAFCHLPLIINTDGNKLSKQNHAPAIDGQVAGKLLMQALQILGQISNQDALYQELSHQPAELVIKWALEHFDFEKIPAIQEVS